MTWILAAPFAVLAVYSVFSAFKYTRMISSIFLGLVYRPSPDVVDGVRGEKIMILDSSDHEIPALFLESKGSDRVMIFCHESGSSKESWEKYAYFFPDLGYHVLSMDLTEKTSDTENNSLLQWPREEAVRRVSTVIRWAKRAIAPHARVVLFGVSNGADLALAASDRERTVEAVIADGLFSMKEIFRDYIRRWAPILVKPNLFGERYPDWVVNVFTELGFWHCGRRTREKFVDVEKLLAKKHVPLLMIHGEYDDYVPATHQKFLESLGSGKLSRRFVVREARHNEAVLVRRADYENEVRGFLENVLRSFLFALMLTGVCLFPRASFAADDPALREKLAASEMQAEPEISRLGALLKQSVESYENVKDYKAVFRKQEETNGALGPEETIFLKFEKPFKIFMHWLNTHKEGLQVLYERGRHDGKLAIHKPGLFFGLASVVFLDRNSPWVREGSESYDIEDAGIGSFLYDFSEMFLKGTQEGKIRAQISESPEGPWTDVSFPGSREKDPGYFASRVIVLFDVQNHLPVRMTLYDWEGKITGIYAYEKLSLNVGVPADEEFKRLAERKLYRLFLPEPPASSKKTNFSPR